MTTKVGDVGFWILMKDPETRRAWLRMAAEEMERRSADPALAPEDRDLMARGAAEARQRLRPEPYDPRPEDGRQR
jgi:hypothetical protein